MGLSPEWESEGFDRPTLDMPGRQNELIHRVGQANPNTVVCVQAVRAFASQWGFRLHSVQGSAVSMPWVGDVNAIVQAWYSGNEVGNALSDVLFGKTNPAGRLPLTLPVRAQDIPAYLTSRSENGQIHYREDLFVGYKWYQAMNIAPLFPFGFGLSYTTFAFTNLSTSGRRSDSDPSSFDIDFFATVTNTGAVVGSEVVQLYVTLPYNGLSTPRLQLRGFAKAKDIAPGASTAVKISLDKYAVSYWDAVHNVWTAQAGIYGVSIGKSSADIVTTTTFVLEKGFTWKGI